MSGNSISDVSALSGLTSLTRLFLSGNAISDVSALSGLPSLTWLKLDGNTIADFSVLSGLASLVVLELSADEEIEVFSLSGLTSLTDLTLNGDAEMGRFSLSGLTALTTLTLGGDNEIGTFSLSGLTSLTQLRLNGEIGTISLSDMSSLTQLDLNVKMATFSLSGLTSLTQVTLSGEIGTISLLDLPSLTWLVVAGKINSFSASNLPALTQLILNGSEITDISLSGLTSLIALFLHDNVISDVSALSDLPSLSLLFLHNNAISDVSALSGLNSLTSLSLGVNDISDVSPLSALTSLTSLSLGVNDISDVSPLSALTSLTSLNLPANAVSDISPLSGLNSLTSLNLSANAISDISPLSGLSSMTSLRLSGNTISDISGLSGLTSLRDLYLDRNMIMDVSALGGLGSLSTLILRNNAVADVTPLLDSGLLASGELHIEYPNYGENYVDLQGNPLGDEQTDHILALRESGRAVVFDDGGHRVPLFLSTAARSGVEGFVRVINHSNRAGNVSIEAVDKTGERRGPVSLAIGAGQALHFDAGDLEEGNTGMGLRGVGGGVGNWRLVLHSELDIEVLGFGRSPDGFLTSLHDFASEAYGRSVVPMLIASDDSLRRVGILRLANSTTGHKYAGIRALDDTGRYGSFGSGITTPAGRTVNFPVAQLEVGQHWQDADADGYPDHDEGVNLVGFGVVGAGSWRLNVYAPGQRMMGLQRSPTGHLANISTGTTVSPWHIREHLSWERGGRYRVPLFLGGTDDIQGILRIVNHSAAATEITLQAFNEVGIETEPAMLRLEGNRVLHLTSDDLELGNPAWGLPGIGTGNGDWHLEVSGNRRFEVLTYAGTPDGYFASLHDIAHRAEDGSLWIPFFNPASNRQQASRLRLVNWGETAAEVTITGVDDAGNSPGEAVRITVPARSARDYMAWDLETGNADGFSGALGDGMGRWRLRISAPADIEAMSLLTMPTGYIANLSTTPRYPQE